jgi:antitoxin component of MazEF toxin-antitoxin module
MIENISESTVVTTARKGSASLRATIPEILVKLFKIEEGDKLAWSVNKDKKIEIRVEKK